MPLKLAGTGSLTGVFQWEVSFVQSKSNGESRSLELFVEELFVLLEMLKLEVGCMVESILFWDSTTNYSSGWCKPFFIIWIIKWAEIPYLIILCLNSPLVHLLEV